MLLLDTAVNYFAILAAAVAMMAIGLLWYSPLLFDKKWKYLLGLTGKKLENTKNNNTKSYIITSFGTLVSSFVLAHFINFAAAYTPLDGAAMGFWLGLGIIVPAMLGDVLFAGKSWKLYLINIGNTLLGLMVAGAILAVWV